MVEGCRVHCPGGHSLCRRAGYVGTQDLQLSRWLDWVSSANLYSLNYSGYTLLHRYSFNDGTASDSVGGSAYAGSLMAGATVTSYQATFSTSDQYVNLPSGLFGSYTAVSVEAWVTTGVNSAWTRVFQFGANVVSAGTNTNSILVQRDSSNAIVLSWYNSAGTQSGFISSAPFDSQTSLHVVVTISAGDNARLYINRVLQGTTPAVVNSIPLPSVFYISKSFDGNPGLVGSVNEFRIWGGVLSATDIATRYSQGPGEIHSEWPLFATSLI